MKSLQKLAQKHDIPYEVVKTIITSYHVTKNLTKKKDLRKISINFEDSKVLSKVEKIAKDLKVDVSAVLCGFTLHYIETKECISNKEK